MAATPTGQTAAAKWASAMANAGQAYTQGIQATTDNPMAKAAAAVNNYAQGVAQAVSSGKFVNSLQAVPMSHWQQQSIQKGAQRLGTGAQAAQNKFANVMGQVINHIQAVKSSLPARGPKGSNDQRMLAFSQGMRQFKRS